MTLAVSSVPGFKWPRAIWIVAAVGALIVYAGIRHSHHPNPAKQIAAAMGNHTYCASTNYGLVNNLTGSKTWIYSCVGLRGRLRCMVRSNGVVSDVTAEARLVYANSFSGKPDCV